METIMTNILKILFICAFLIKQPCDHADSVCIPVEIKGGGTIRIEPLNASESGYEQQIEVADGESANAWFTFDHEGTWTYSLHESEALDPQAQKDPAVYILKIVCAENGKVEQVLLYEKGKNEKSGSALWINRTKAHSPDTSDSFTAGIYAVTSFISLIIVAVLFRYGEGDDDEA